MDLNDKVAIVTGASSGIGRATSLKLAGMGVKTVLVARSKERLEMVSNEIGEFQKKALVASTDITSLPEVERMVQKVLNEFGKIDILVNSAFWGPPGNLENTTEEVWDRTINTSLKGPFLCIRSVVPFMKRQGGGRIVNIGSRAGKGGEDNRTAYCAAKWGLEGLTAALREELTRENIYVHLISPGATNTPFWPSAGAKLDSEVLSRFIPPETIAENVAWILQQPDQVLIQDVLVYNFRKPFEGKAAPFSNK
jgi:NAD(P)-dependent dehydrogenase (short-subunit alcohol dehydrogenase family)